MSRAELKQYVLTHRNDEEAIRELFDRPRPNAMHFPADMPPQEIEQVVQEKLDQVDKSE